ncbi:MAG: hypothetical protein WD873_07880 [Candidatus Hydrogenedentales bacterium]
MRRRELRAGGKLGRVGTCPTENAQGKRTAVVNLTGQFAATCCREGRLPMRHAARDRRREVAESGKIWFESDRI